MSKFDKEAQKELKELMSKEVLMAEEDQIRKTKVVPCRKENHSWRQISDNEIACNVCPTMWIIEPWRMDEYLK